MIYTFLSLTLLVPWASVQACSNLLLTKEAMVDQANTISYNADSAALYGSLYHYPAATNKAGTMKQIYDWDTGVYLGEIALPEETYNVVGNTNEVKRYSIRA